MMRPSLLLLVLLLSSSRVGGEVWYNGNLRQPNEVGASALPADQDPESEHRTLKATWTLPPDPPSSPTARTFNLAIPYTIADISTPDRRRAVAQNVVDNLVAQNFTDPSCDASCAVARITVLMNKESEKAYLLYSHGMISIKRRWRHGEHLM